MKKAIFAVALRGATYLQYAFEIPLHVTSAPQLENEEVFWRSVYVTLNCSTLNAAIYYTLDGSDPLSQRASNTTMTYSGYSIEVMSERMHVVLRAVAVANHVSSDY